MKKPSIAILILFIGAGLFSRDLSELSFGTDSTFEIMTWKIEWFPKNGQTTVD